MITALVREPDGKPGPAEQAGIRVQQKIVAVNDHTNAHNHTWLKMTAYDPPHDEKHPSGLYEHLRTPEIARGQDAINNVKPYIEKYVLKGGTANVQPIVSAKFVLDVNYQSRKLAALLLARPSGLPFLPPRPTAGTKSASEDPMKELDDVVGWQLKTVENRMFSRISDVEAVLPELAGAEAGHAKKDRQRVLTKLDDSATVENEQTEVSKWAQARTNRVDWNRTAWVGGIPTYLAKRAQMPLDQFLHGRFSEFGPIKLSNIKTRFKDDDGAKVNRTYAVITFETEEAYRKALEAVVEVPATRKDIETEEVAQSMKEQEKLKQFDWNFWLGCEAWVRWERIKSGDL
eukprot:SAG31_NODE_7190_length_1761_cov_5.311071_1_plen_345_part_00